MTWKHCTYFIHRMSLLLLINHKIVVLRVQYTLMGYIPLAFSEAPVGDLCRVSKNKVCGVLIKSLEFIDVAGGIDERVRVIRTRISTTSALHDFNTPM